MVETGDNKERIKHGLRTLTLDASHHKNTRLEINNPSRSRANWKLLTKQKRHPRLEPLVEQEYNHGHTTHDLLVAFGLGQKMEEGRR